MTRRKIVFHNSQNGTYVISDEYNGDKSEMEQFGLGSCDNTWDEFMEAMSDVDNLASFLIVISHITASYHPTINGTPTPDQMVRMVGSRLNVVHSRDEMLEKVSYLDEVWMVESGKPGAHMIEV